MPGMPAILEEVRNSGESCLKCRRGSCRQLRKHEAVLASENADTEVKAVLFDMDGVLCDREN
jgi:hypothetical protein